MADPKLKYAIGNSASTTLSSSMSDSATTAALTSDTNFAAKSGAGEVIIDEGTATEELAYATGKSGASLTIPLANRGLEGGSAQAHNSTATVKGILTAGMWNDLIDSLLNVLDQTAGTVKAGVAMTSPKITTGINDANNNELIKVTATTDAVNELTLANAADGNNVVISATGGSSGVGIDVKMKGLGRFRKPSVVGIQVFDAGTSTSTGDAKAFFRVPPELNGMNLTRVAATVYTAGTTGTTDIQIRNKTDTTDMLSTKLTIDSTETDTATAANAAVIDTSKDDVVTGDVLAIDVDAVHTTPAKGLYVELYFELP